MEEIKKKYYYIIQTSIETCNVYKNSIINQQNI